jgi:hypothetical protein
MTVNLPKLTKSHLDKANEFLGEEDLTVKGKFSFLNKNFVKINFNNFRNFLLKQKLTTKKENSFQD